MSGSAAPPALTAYANGIGVASDQQLNSMMQTGAVVTDLRAFVGLSRMTVWMVGTTDPNDGGQGAFYWNATSTASDDNGVTCVAPNGLLAGRWLRQSGNASGITAVTNIAALRLLNNAASPVWVQGYYTPGDGGEGMFNVGAAASDNGGTIIVSQNGTYRREQITAGVSYRQFGAKGDGTTDDTAAIQACITASVSQGFPAMHPVGQFLVSSVITDPGAGPVTILGVNPGKGPGIVSDTECSILLCKGTFTTGDVLSFTTLYSVIVRDIQIAGALSLGFQSASPRSSGAGIHITGPTGHVNSGSEITNVCFSGMADGIVLTRCNEDTKVSHTYHQAWANGCRAIYADNGNTSVESSMGILTDNQFFGNLAATQAACVEAHCGYGSFTRNKCLGAQFGLIVAADQPVNIGVVVVSLNSFEELTVQGIEVTQTASHLIAGVQIVANQFSNLQAANGQAHISVMPSGGGSGANIYDVVISDNVFNSVFPGGASAFISVYATNALVKGNVGNVLGGAGAYGLSVNASSPQVSAIDNVWASNGGPLLGTTGYFLGGPTMIRDTASRAFTVALLPAGAVAGSELWVTDGKATSFGTGNLLVTGGGSGCTAWRMGGGWLTIET